MEPFICRKHGEVIPYCHTIKTGEDAGRTTRTCPVCKSERGKKRYDDNRQEIAQYHAEWYWKNRDHALKVSSDYRSKLRQEIVTAYGGKCECCGESMIEFLSVDHINGGGYKLRNTTQKGGKFYRDLRRLGFPKDEYRLLCMNCNFSLGKYGYCPHQTATAA